MFYGIKPAVAAIILDALHRIASKSLSSPRTRPVPWAITAESLVAIWALYELFPLVVLGAMALGAVLWRLPKAALLTFGGAYAVLRYANSVAVEHYQWRSTPQMMDGLALGEATPTLLIMVVAFVWFVAGWAQQVLGP